MDKLSSLYTSGEYTQKNSDYHSKDSPFKWRNFQKVFKTAVKSNKISLDQIHAVCEIGCGAGGILNCLRSSDIFPFLTKVEGWDINPSAIDMAKRQYVGIDFFCKDVFSSGNHYDLMLCADVFEHVENPYQFLRDLSNTADYFLFNIPLESNLLSMLQGRRIIRSAYESVGHLHFYSASTAEMILEVSGYQILSKRFAGDRTGNLFAYPSLRKTIATIPQFLLEFVSPYLSSVLMGDHLVVLASHK
jgi:hypothetical protein